MTAVHTYPHFTRGGDPYPEVREVGPGIFAFVQLDGSWGLNNPGFLVGKKGIIAIDTCFTETRSRALKDAIRGVSPLPVTTLLNTHHHGDHTWGNFLFPESTIIGHRLCREETIATELGPQAIFTTAEWGQVEVEPPFVTFEDRLTIWLDNLELKMEFAGPAHTTNDSFIWIPELKLLFSGDLVFSHCTPFIIQGSLAGHLTALERVRQLGAEVIVPGHGDICGPDAIEDGIAYLRFVQETARKTFNAGLTPFEAAKATDLGRFGEWHESERLVANLHRAYSEIRGEPLGKPLSLNGVIEEMIAMNGGKPLRCFA